MAVTTTVDDVQHVIERINAVWEQPKTDWYGSRDTDGVYQGDRFNSEDYNRIKNNLVFLHELANVLYPEFGIEDMGEDKGKADYPYADEINLIEQNLNTIAADSAGFDYGESPTYVAQGKVLDFNELNRIEGAILDMFNQLCNEYQGRRHFEFMFGTKGEF
jgi:hypothetical protein